jgi:hypothetical protein
MMIDARFPFCSNINFAVRNRARCHAVTNGEKISLSSFMDYFELNLLVCSMCAPEFDVETSKLVVCTLYGVGKLGFFL